MNAVAYHLNFLIGGSADLNPSTNTVLKGKGNFQPPGPGDGTIQGSVSGSWGLQIGAHACLYKPLEANELLGIIEQISRYKIRNLLGDPICATGR